MTRRLVLAAVLFLGLLAPQLGWGHAERPTTSPPRPGAVPDQNRVPLHTIDVCKVANEGCGYEHIQAAVTAAEDDTLIRIWPGFYREEPSRAEPDLPADNPDGTYSYQFHEDHPNAANLIAIVGKKNITLRGMGASPRDVVVDVEFTKHVGIRGDRADGIIIENLSVWHALHHGVYILDTDGFIIDRIHSGYSRDYPFLTFANDHGLMKNCEAFGGGDGGLYPGGSADTPRRNSMEIDRCKSYHNVLGYSGTQGDHVWVHDSEFFDNAVGLVSDSETNHPNYPQNNLILEGNKFYDNNFNVYAAGSDVKATVFADSILLPVGVGVFLASGNRNLARGNYFWGNDRFGLWLASGEGLVIGPTSDPPGIPFVSSGNRFIGNTMFNPDAPEGSQNGIDFGWDGMGLGNCWEDNFRSPDGAPATSDAFVIPPCTIPVLGGVMPTTVGVPNPPNLLAQAGLVFVDGAPLACLIGDCVWGPGPAPENARNLPEGYQAPEEPVACGPVSC